MDINTIDREYSQLQAEFGEVTQAFQSLASKLQAAAQAGDTSARDWLLDLKQVALSVKDEQVQTNALLQAMHGFVNNSFQAPIQPNAYPPQQGYGYQGGGMLGGLGGMVGGGRGGGMFGRFRGSGFARAMEMGAGIGLGEDIINSIF